jgi:hypothetical protein
VIFRVAAGPGRGFGHLMRCRALADAMGATRVVSLRASRPTRVLGRRLGWTIAGGDRAVLSRVVPDLLVVDDPSASAARPWVEAARRLGIPVASIHDGGRGRLPSDLTIDGSLVAVSSARAADLQGPAYAVLDPRIAIWRAVPTRRRRGLVVITLGGGRHVRRHGAAIARAIVASRPGTRVRLVQGFGPRPAATLPNGCRWVRAPRGVAPLLARAMVAVVGGGITLSEACAVGAPVVAVAVVPAQRPAARAAAAAGAAIDASHAVAPRATAAAAAAVVRLLDAPHLAVRLGARGRALVDGCGASRVARALERLMAQGAGRPRRAA